ncbi:winged helix-turn-helix transcriptional regulator [Pseudolysinimonas sp.]|uniref:winged helix-turn-helix transcriptional regulator n=1 Tax=Pseudolysinimonas sp. TaxID=2680009 RepID=UPI003F818EFE
MPLGSDYASQHCAIARSLEIVGERWTLLIVRDLFYGVRRFNDLRKHIGAPSATLAQRLGDLVEAGVVARVPGRGARDEYELTERGRALWPVLRELGTWGGACLDPDERHAYTHATCGSVLVDGRCPACGIAPPAEDIVMHPAERQPADADADPVTRALGRPHRLLEPLAV